MSLSIQADSTYAELTSPLFEGLQKFTVCGWVMATATAGTDRGVWSLGKVSVGGNKLMGQFSSSNGTLEFVTYQSSAIKYRWWTTNFVDPLNTWVFYSNSVDLSGGTQDTVTTIALVDGGWRDLTLSTDASATGAIPVQNGATFRLGMNHDSAHARCSVAYMRMYDKLLSPQEIAANMYSRRCPPRLTSRCLVDLPLEGNLNNYGRTSAAPVISGTTTFAGAPAFSERRSVSLLAVPVLPPGLIAPSGITSSSSFGSDDVTLGPQIIDITAGTTSSSSFGTASVSTSTIVSASPVAATATVPSVALKATGAASVSAVAALAVIPAQSAITLSKTSPSLLAATGAMPSIASFSLNAVAPAPLLVSILDPSFEPSLMFGSNSQAASNDLPSTGRTFSTAVSATASATATSMAAAALVSALVLALDGNVAASALSAVGAEPAAVPSLSGNAVTSVLASTSSINGVTFSISSAAAVALLEAISDISNNELTEIIVVLNLDSISVDGEMPDLTVINSFNMFPAVVHSAAASAYVSIYSVDDWFLRSHLSSGMGAGSVGVVFGAPAKAIQERY